MGIFFGGKFYLTVSLPWDETTDPDKVAFIQTLFQKVSEYLYTATNKTHSLGGIFYSPMFVAANTDIEIHAGGGASPDAVGALLWNATRVDAYEDFLADVSLLVHELGHYLYDVRDEYLGNVWSCVNNSASGSCLMELYNDADRVRWRKSANPAQYYLTLQDYLDDEAASNATFHANGLSFFCWGDKKTPPPGTHGDHDPDTLTPQNNKYSKHSCWEVMVDDAIHGNIPYGLVYPAAGPSTTLVPVPAALPPIEPLIPVERVALLIDRSGSMLGPKFEGAKIGAEAVIDLLKSGQEAALASFANTPALSASIDVVPSGASLAAWRTNLKFLLGVLNPGGATGIGPGLDLARTAIAGLDLAARQSILLLSDGRENVYGPSVEQAIPDLVADNVRVYPIGFGSDQDDVLLMSLAEKTGGNYLPLAPTLTASEIQAAIPEVMMYLAGAIAEMSMVTALYDVDDSYADDVDVTPFRWGDFPVPASTSSSMPPQEIILPVEISPGSKGCTIGCSWDSAGKRIEVDVLRPGETLPHTKGVRKIRGPRAYAFFSFGQSPPGTWKLRISGPDLRDTRFKIYGFQVHPKLRIETHVGPGIVPPGGEVEICAFLRAPAPIPGATVRAWIFKPDGTWDRVQLVGGDGGNAGTYSAMVPTLSGVDGSYLVCVDAELASSSSPSKIPTFKLRKLTSFVADSSGLFDGKPLRGTNSKPPRIPPGQRDRYEAWMKRHKRG